MTANAFNSFGFKNAAGALTQPLVNDDSRVEVYALGGKYSALNVSTSTVIKASAGKLVQVNVTTAGAAGAVHDVATTGAAAAGNKIATIPAVVGSYVFNWPCAAGIVYAPGASQVVSISYI